MNRSKKAIDMYKSSGSPNDRRDAREPDSVAGATGEAAGEQQVHGLLVGSESGAQKAAKFLLLLSKTDAAEILKALSPEEAERVAVEIARVRRVDFSEARSILDEFGRIAARGGVKRGGPDTAKEMLTTAFGEERGSELFYRAVPTGRLNPFDFLDELEFHQILLVLKNEPASVVSVVLPYMYPEKAARVLEALHPDLQRDVARRVSKIEKIDPEVLAQIANVLRERIRRQGRVETEEIDGRRVLAEILRYSTTGMEEEILEDLKLYDSELSTDIEERLLTIDVLFQMRDQDLEAILRDFSDTEIAVIVKGKEDEVRDRVFANLSERRNMLVREEMERLGPMKRSEVASATKDFLLYIKDLEDDGRLVIETEDEYLVD